MGVHYGFDCRSDHLGVLIYIDILIKFNYYLFFLNSYSFSIIEQFRFSDVYKIRSLCIHVIIQTC